MGKFSLTTHETRKTKAGSTNTVATQPYARISGPDGVYFLQNGKFWSEGGPELKNVPAWAMAQADALTDAVKKEVGWGVQNSDKARAEALSAGKPANEVADPNQPMQAPAGTAGRPLDDKKPVVSEEEHAKQLEAQHKADAVAAKAQEDIDAGKSVKQATVNYGKPVDDSKVAAKSADDKHTASKVDGKPAKSAKE